VPDDADEIRDLRGHIDAAHAAADRLVRDAQQRAERSDEAFRERLADVPERGWEVPGGEAPPARPSELEIVVKLLGSLRDAMPAELSQQLAESVRELLLAVRALIDWYLDRIEKLPKTGRPSERGDRVEDIPIS